MNPEFSSKNTVFSLGLLVAGMIVLGLLLWLGGSQFRKAAAPASPGQVHGKTDAGAANVSAPARQAETAAASSPGRR